MNRSKPLKTLRQIVTALESHIERGYGKIYVAAALIIGRHSLGIEVSPEEIAWANQKMAKLQKPAVRG